MQLNIFRDINLINPVFDQIAKIYRDFIISHDAFKEEIKLNQYTLIHRYKQALYNINFTKNFTPEIKTATDTRVLFLLIVQYIKKDKNKIEHIKPLVSKLRLSLFESREKLIYLKNLFQYFNALYRILNSEQTVLSNASAKINDKSYFIDKSQTSVNKVFERVYELLLNELFPGEKDLSDVWDLFCIGEDVVRTNGKLTEDKKSKFFVELTKAINKENDLLGVSFNDSFGNRSASDNKDSEIDFINLFDEEGLFIEE
jgi:hypothetical protein